MMWLGVTAHPTAEWIARQLNEACGWKQPPTFLIRDLDGAYGDIFKRRLRAMGIRDKPTTPPRLGRMDIANVCSAQSDENALITS